MSKQLSRFLLKHVKRVLKYTYQVLARRFGCGSGMSFKSLMAACRTETSLNTLVTPASISLDHKLSSGVSIHENIISYPLSAANSQNRLGDYFFGGLAAAETLTLVPEAIHYNGVAYSQSLPASYIETHSLKDCLKVRRPTLFAGILFNHFGHFVSESLSRLYAYPAVQDINPFIFFYAPWGIPKYWERTSFVNQILTGFGISIDRLIFTDSVVTFREIIVPRQEYGFGFLHQPDDIFVKYVRSFRFRYEIPEQMKNSEKVYVTRTSTGRKRGSQIGEKLFEQYLLGEGYKVFHPEQHTLFEQLTVYSYAKRLIFSEGSAILSCILLPDLAAEVAVVCRRRDPRRNIRVATDCLQGYGKNILWIDAVHWQYQCGFDTWDAMAYVDWLEVSHLLREHDFVGKPFDFTTYNEDQSALIRAELSEYIREISGDPRFLEYILSHREAFPLWEGPSHLTDPRSGSKIWPPLIPYQ